MLKQPTTFYFLSQIHWRSSKVIYHPTGGAVWKHCSTRGLLNSKTSWKKGNKVQCKRQWSLHSEIGYWGSKEAKRHIGNCCLEYSLLPSKAGTSVPSVILCLWPCIWPREIRSLTQRLSLSLPPLWHHGAWEPQSCLKYLSLRWRQA